MSVKTENKNNQEKIRSKKVIIKIIIILFFILKDFLKFREINFKK